LKKSITNLIKNPKTNPRINEPNISIEGNAIKEKASGVTPVAITFEIDTERENKIKPKASSKATTGKSKSTNGPLALYWWITINVAAGAVAVAIAPRHKETSSGKFNK
jgi:hypothetical protein